MHEMTPADWQQVKHLFHAALERDPSERASFLDEACSGDAALRSEVQALIQSHEKEGRFIDEPAYELAADLIVSQPPAIAAGQSLGSYRIVSVLGRGGMGEVYLAEDARLGRKVALKFLPASYNTDLDRLRRFEREARAASALNHPNILTIYEVGSFDGRQFIATEFVEGETLRQRQLHSPLKVNEILELALQVSSALAAAHQAGIVHRDIKPENIMLRHDGYAKVVDFGLAKLTETRQASADISTLMQVDTGTGVVMGTTAYMSPEQARGLILDSRTDIWSLGVVLYELLSGATPFKGATPSDLIVSILEREPSPLARTPLVPSELDWIVRKALRKDREERYQTARELLGDLRSVKQQLEFSAQIQRSDSDQRGLETGAQQTGASAENPFATGIISPAVATNEHTAAGKSSRSVVVGLVAMMLLATVVLAYKFFPRAKAPQPFEKVTLTRITNSGKAIDATISPDGKYIVYALSDAGQQSLWIRQVSTANDKEIVPAAPVGFFGITFSPDGNDLYYAVKANQDRGTLYRVPVLGGTARKILEGIDGPVSFSPDGRELVLVRGNFPGAGQSALVISNVDGGNERTLATRKAPEAFSPIFFGGPSWSPDGKLIAASVARVGSQSHVFAFAVADGKEIDLTPEPWPFTARVQWLDMHNLLVVAGDNAGNAQVWMISYPDGNKRRITNDLATYRALGISADGKKLSTVQSSGLVNIWIAPDGDAKRAMQLPTGNVGFFGSAGVSLDWVPDGRIVFVSNESGLLDLWIMEATGGNRRQLTATAGHNGSPVVSHDGRFIVFTSSRSGTKNVWRMAIDGSNPKQLTTGAADLFPTLSPDDSWVFYSSITDGRATLWRVPAEGGTPVEIVNRLAIAPDVSPDGKFVVYLYTDSTDSNAPPNHFAIIPIEGGEPVRTFAFQTSGTITAMAQWSHDGRSILYPVNNRNVTNVWAQPIDGGPPKQLTDFKDSLITGFSWSRDGKTLALTRGVLLRDAVLISE